MNNLTKKQLIFGGIFTLIFSLTIFSAVYFTLSRFSTLGTKESLLICFSSLIVIISLTVASTSKVMKKYFPGSWLIYIVPTNSFFGILAAGMTGILIYSSFPKLNVMDFLIFLIVVLITLLYSIHGFSILNSSFPKNFNNPLTPFLERPSEAYVSKKYLLWFMVILFIIIFLGTFSLTSIL